MRKMIQIFSGLVALMLTLQLAWGFSQIGPIGNGGDAWQIPAIAYGYNDPVAPKDIYEEYRFVTPVMYYAADASLLNYYGLDAMTNIDAAFAILNGVMCGQTNQPVYLYSPTSGIYVSPSGVPTGPTISLSAAGNLDQYSGDLTEFPLEAVQVNYTAKTLGVYDVKSEVLHTVIGEIGLAAPDRYVWSMHDRLLNPQGLQNPKCPDDVEYLVVIRNFDVNPTKNYPYTPYINNTLYTYYIYENCGNRQGLPYDARTRPAPADPFGDSYATVASYGLLSGVLSSGSFYDNLTRDDVAGLRYLYSSNNINFEATAPSGVTLIETNVGTSVPLVTQDLGALISASKTNDPATLITLYPGLIATGVATNYALGFVTNYTSYYTNYIGSAWSNPPVLVNQTSVTPAWLTNYVTVFGNVKTNHYYTNTTTKVLTTSVTNLIGAPIGSPLVTNYTYKTVVLTNTPSGDFFLLGDGSSSNAVVDYKITSVLYTNLVITSNVLTSATNGVGSSTNTTSTNAYSYTQTILTYSTNYWMLVQPMTVVSSTPVPALRRGIGRIQFIRANYDSLLGQFFQPLTNTYSMVMITNSQSKIEWYQRVVTTPDFLFQSQDLTVPTTDFPYGVDFNVTTPTFNSSNALSTVNGTGWAGPGTIVVPGTGIVTTFNKNENPSFYVNGSLSSYDLGTNQYLNVGTQSPVMIWGGFGSSTNPPVIYPSSTSVANLMNQMLFQMMPVSIPDGTNGVAYTVSFSAQGGQPPYTWAAPDISSQIPGMSFNNTTHTLSGVPTTSGTFNFTIQLTDTANRVVNFGYAITIH